MSAPVRPPPRALVALIVALCVAGPAGLLVDRAISERARLTAPLMRGADAVTTELPLLRPSDAARRLRRGAARPLGFAGSGAEGLASAWIVGESDPPLPPPDDRRRWMLLCDDGPSCQRAADLGDRLVAAGHPVVGLVTQPEELIDTLERPRPRSLLAVGLERLQSRLLAPVAVVAGAVGWLLALAGAPFALALVFLPVALPPARPADLRLTAVLTLGRAARIGALALLASATLASAPAPDQPSTVGAVVAALAIAASGALSARTWAGRLGAAAVAVAALPWLLGWPLTIHALLVGAAAAEATLARRVRLAGERGSMVPP